MAMQKNPASSPDQGGGGGHSLVHAVLVARARAPEAEWRPASAPEFERRGWSVTPTVRMPVITGERRRMDSSMRERGGRKHAAVPLFAYTP